MKTKIDAALTAALARAEDGAPPRLAAALRYAVFPGGARIRPRLCLAVAEACGDEEPTLVEAAACSIELLHCASLAHDDLPCFDDANLRRGKPSLHRVFGEPLAVLVGDALIVLAFETLARAGASAPERGMPLVAALARAAGSPRGLVAGQAWEGEPSVQLEAYHQAKTCSLFTAAVMSGALAAGRDPAPWRTMGERLGAAYQVADDLLDALGPPDEAGKPTRQDATFGRPNAVALLGVDGAVARLRELVAQAAESVPPCPGAGPLRALALQMAERLVPAGLKQSAA
ncbi:MAG: polyprenyl synthetase family protein [Polyangiaceae bacterium]|jgi:geranylgeranyl diphosphate synthase type II|nr:polyprenyl synthetase family protein [Polyangiaceae bacterium]